MTNYEVRSVSCKSQEYPPLLKMIRNPPEPLYYVGKYHADLFLNSLAVVGSRAMTMYGEWVVNSIVKEVARYGVTIISGFMYGVDSSAHKAALDVGGKTVAVMAGGVTNIFPRSQQDLYEEIADTGLVVSEYGQSGAEGKWMFVRRNRVVAGLCSALLVVEAGEGSGSLITAGYARKFGRQVMAVPGNLNARNSAGTIKLLKEGAKLISCADDILSAFNLLDNYRTQKARAVIKRYINGGRTGDSQDAGTVDAGTLVMEALSYEPLSADELSTKLTLSPSTVLEHLTALTLTASVSEREGRYYVN